MFQRAVIAYNHDLLLAPLFTSFQLSNYTPQFTATSSELEPLLIPTLWLPPVAQSKKRGNRLSQKLRQEAVLTAAPAGTDRIRPHATLSHTSMLLREAH